MRSIPSIQIATLFGAAVTMACAQGERATVDKQMDLLRLQVARCEAQVQSQTEAVLALDKRMEERIDDVVSLLATVSDSSDSKTRVTGVKQDVIEGLEKCMAFYRQRRAARIESVRTGMSAEPMAQNEEALRFLDAKVEKRIEQILEVAASLTQHEQWKRTEKYYGSGRHDGGGGPGNVETTEHRRHTKNVSRSGHEKQDVAEALSEDADNLRAENERLRRSLAYAKTDEVRARIEAQIVKNEEAGAKRREQVRSVLVEAQAPGKSLSKHAAFETAKWISDMVQDIGQDHRQLVRVASERKNDVARLKMWQGRLARAEAATAPETRTRAP